MGFIFRLSITVLLISFCTHCFVFGQVPLDSIYIWRANLKPGIDDQERLSLISKLAFGYRFSHVDSSLYFNTQALTYAQKLNKPDIEANILSLRGATLLENGRLPESLHFQFEALNKSIQINDSSTIAFALNRIGNTYMELGNYAKAKEYYFQSWQWFEWINDTRMVLNEMSNIGNVHELQGVPDSALHYQIKVYKEVNESTERTKLTRPELMFRLGNAYKLNGDTTKAIEFYKMGIDEANIDRDLRNLTMNHLFLARLYKDLNQFDSSRKYAYLALHVAKEMPFTKGIFESATIISDLFVHDNRYDSSFAYLNIANKEKERLTGTERLLELQNILLNQQENQRLTEARRISDENRQKQLLLFLGIAVIFIIALILLWNNRQKQRANVALNAQKQKAEQALEQLTSAQKQLIQSEKMASLGELTAGIAHEIQNPLNFVNNFSEVNKELADELEKEANKGNLEEVKAIAKDIKENEEKINHHGKRADAIVKGMLQHSRTNSGQKEFTDINALCEEYSRLAYHGFRAKDKFFNAKLKTDFDKSLPKINVVTQDIGRVVLNLINNAFYAVSEKQKNYQADADEAGYEPTVSISKKKINDKIEISVKDNGNGIPENIKDKIFQPFFTTKPTGQGTGLGLSLSYDIVKAHGGVLKVNTNEGEGTEFIIQLPAV